MDDSGPNSWKGNGQNDPTQGGGNNFGGPGPNNVNFGGGPVFPPNQGSPAGNMPPNSFQGTSNFIYS